MFALTALTYCTQHSHCQSIEMQAAELRNLDHWLEQSTAGREYQRTCETSRISQSCAKLCLVFPAKFRHLRWRSPWFGGSPESPLRKHRLSISADLKITLVWLTYPLSSFPHYFLMFSWWTLKKRRRHFRICLFYFCLITEACFYFVTS